MSYHVIFAGIVAVTALSMFVNEQFLKLPKTIALTIISVSLSFSITQLIRFTPSIMQPIHTLLSGVDFKTTVLDVMLGYLLFASSLHINTIALKKHFSVIFYLASLGVVTSTIFTGFILWKISHWVHFPLDIADCLIFGALISPTDPIAVASVFQTTKNVPEQIKTKITGESLFNDAAGILLLVILVRIFYMNDASTLSFTSISWIVIKEALGGILWGIIVGYLTAILLSRTNDTEVGILLTLAASSGGYIIANKLHLYGAITMVIAGLIVGNLSKTERFCATTVLSLNKFWDLVDGILNAFLFVLIGLEMLTINVNYSVLLMGALGIIVVFVARFGSMLLPTIGFFIYDRQKYAFKWSEMLLLCWGGIRGAISVALALSIADFPGSLVAITYFIVIFSILIQGSSFKWLVNKVYPE
jgi:CPA1 family monovalent cation:H+ antiporter